MKNEHVIDLLKKLPSNFSQDLDKNLCICMDVPNRQIIEAIVKSATTLEDVKKETYAATGAGCCKQQVEKLINELAEPAAQKRPKRRKK